MLTTDGSGTSASSLYIHDNHRKLLVVLEWQLTVFAGMRCLYPQLDYSRCYISFSVSYVSFFARVWLKSLQ